MKERDLTCQFRNWLKANWKSSAAFELKICKTDRFNLKCIAEHQIANLELANKGLFYFKIQDLGFQCPFDCFTLFQVPAYVVIFFYKPRQPKKFYLIHINEIEEMLKNNIKSINEFEAADMAYRAGELK